MKSDRKHSFEVRVRAFGIWQKLGVLPWRKADAGKGKKGPGDFYKGAFDGIPFLNDDAKRTFSHLLLRPGYMIRDYIKGEHERYLAPLTALIIFYAFFALVSSVLSPMQQKISFDNIPVDLSIEEVKDTARVNLAVQDIAKIVRTGYIYKNLDQFPEEVHTQAQASLAALEGALRSQGIPLFIGEFLILWLSMIWALRRYKLKASACAAASAYVLCQFSFFMLFAVLLTLGKSASISAGLMMLLLVIDYHQWLNISWGDSIKRTIMTGVFYALIYLAIILLISAVVLLIAFFKNGVI